jgi:hypothetical protein
MKLSDRNQFPGIVITGAVAGFSFGFFRASIH